MCLNKATFIESTVIIMSDGVNRVIVLLLALVLVAAAIALSALKVKPIPVSNLAGFNIFETLDNGNIVFIGDDGTKGYANSKGEVILKPKWNSIKPIIGDRFIVSKSGSQYMGIINYDEKVISPFIYRKFEKSSDKLLIGYTVENGKFFLLNSNGNRYANEEWDTIKYTDDSNFTVTQGKSVYSCGIENNKLIVNNITLSKNVLDKEISINFVPNATLPQIPFITYEKITDTSIDFVTAMLNNDKVKLKELCTSKFYNKLKYNNDYKNCKITEKQVDTNDTHKRRKRASRTRWMPKDNVTC